VTVRESVPLGPPPAPAIAIVRPEKPAELLENWCSRADLSVPIPYWAEIWPASRALAQHLAVGPSLAGSSVLDLGCGLGLAGIAAGLRGGAVHFADNHADALTFARTNAEAAGLDAVFLPADWRAASWAGPFDLVLAADVLYDRSDHEPLLDLLPVLLGAGGVALFGDPHREASARFFDDWRSHPGALLSTCGEISLPEAGAVVTLRELRYAAVS
jgi:predicted nicotinamide N-methyase